MNSLIEVNEDSAIDIQAIKPRIKDSPKITSFSFFIFHLIQTKSPSNSQEGSLSNLQKLAFKLREENDKNGNQVFKQICLYFCELENQNDSDHSLIEMKTQMQDNKTKMVVYGYQSNLIQLIKRATLIGVDIANVPIVFYGIGLHNDLSSCLGWANSQSLQNVSTKVINDFEQNVKKWISSPSQKIDMWEVIVEMKEEGSIYQLLPNGIQYTLLPIKELRQSFLSHFSAGYHSKLSMDYQVNRKSENSKIMNKIIYSMESFKKFCCVGTPNMKAATGVVNVNFKDQKNHNIQILKEFRDYNGEKGEELMGKQKRINQKRILTIALSNIDRFHGQKLKNLRSSKMNDGKVQLLSFESQTDYSQIASINGQVVLKLQSQEEVSIQVNSTCYKLVHPQHIKIRLERKLKILINKDLLEC